jgi:putative ABC transport system substrate-binding protein
LRYLILAIATTLLIALPASAAEVLILQSNLSRTMEQMTRLVQNECAGNHRTLVLSDYAEFDLGRLIREERPAVVVAIGDQALKIAKKQRRVPVIYSMTLNPGEESLGDNISGVSMMVSPKNYMNLFTALKRRRVGVIHDKAQTGAYLRRATEAAHAMGIELVLLPVTSAQQVQHRLADLRKRQVDAIWLVPDSTALTPETVDSYFEFAQQNNLPVIGFSSAYLSKGALASVEVTRQEISRQLCSKIRTARAGHGSGTTDAPAGKLLFNNAVAERLGIKIPSGSILTTEASND